MNLVALAEDQAAGAMLVKVMSSEMMKRLDGANALIANQCSSVDQEKLRTDRADDRVHYCNQQISVLHRVIDTL